MTAGNNPLAEDLDHVLTHTTGIWDPLCGKRLFLSGGSGFFGRWLLESLLWANRSLGLGASAWVLTRNPEMFRTTARHLACDPAIHLVQGDARCFEFPAGEFFAVVHAATETYFEADESRPFSVFDKNIQATAHMLDFARQARAQRFLFTSSGAVYGQQPPTLTHIPEEYAGAPDPMNTASAYGQSKRVSEFMCAMYAKQFGLGTTVARCFAFVGPGLPLDANYAIGNFIRDAMAGGPILVNGDGTPYRSYLYTADLAIWLWTLLFRGASCRPYNVGSEEAIAIADLARKVVDTVAPGAQIRIATRSVPGVPSARYVPSVRRAEQELQLSAWVPLEEAVRRTVRWHVQRARSGSGTSKW